MEKEIGAKKDLHCPTCDRSMQQRSSKIFNTFRPMAIQDHRPLIPSIGISIKKMDENQWWETRRIIREIQVCVNWVLFNLLVHRGNEVSQKIFRFIYRICGNNIFLHPISAFLEIIEFLLVFAQEFFISREKMIL